MPTYETDGSEGGTRSRSEHDLVQRYFTWATGAGIKTVSRIYREPGLARPFLCDLFLPDKNMLIEARSNDSRTTIRLAIGQLLDYQHFEASIPSLAILLPYSPATEIRSLLSEVTIAVIWPHGDRFRDSAGGTCTRP